MIHWIPTDDQVAALCEATPGLGELQAIRVLQDQRAMQQQLRRGNARRQPAPGGLPAQERNPE